MFGKASSKSRNHARMRDLVNGNIRFVTRALTRAGVPRSELDDAVQRTFIAVAGRLDDVRDGAERSFLFQVARNTASHARRSLLRRREFPSEHMPDWIEAETTPEDLIVRKETRKQLDVAIAGMDEALRAVFVLYEIEEMELMEIARLLAIPRGTVASRLRRARQWLRKEAAAVELAWDLGVEGARTAEEPTVLRRKPTSAFERALLGAGLRIRPSPTMHATTLACLALR